ADETWAMSTVIENSGGKNKLAGGRPGASKTGTWEACAQRNQCPDHPDWVGKNRDAWYAGFTPQLATVVHIGSTDPKNVTIGYYQGGSKKESNMFGINLPGDIWKKFMDSVLNGQPKKGFPDAPRVGDTDKGDPLAPSPPPPPVDQPARSDEFVRGLSEAIGGPLGTHATRSSGGARYYTVARIVLALVCLTLAAHWVQKSPCQDGAWSDLKQYREMCYTDVLALYYNEGLSDGKIPYAQHPVEYPVLT